MASAVHCQLNPQVRSFVPTTMAPKLAYRRGKGEGGEKPSSKHQIRSGNGRWAGRRGMVRLNPRRETKIRGKNGDRKRGREKKSRGGRNSSRANGGGEAEPQSDSCCDKAKRRVEHVHVDGRSQLLRTTYERWRRMGRTELDGH